MLAYTQTRSGLLFSPPFFFVNYATTLYRGRLQKMLACVQTRSGRRFAPTESLKSQCKGIFTTTESLTRQCKGIFTIKSHYTQDFFLNFSILKSENRVMRIKKNCACIYILKSYPHTRTSGKRVYGLSRIFIPQDAGLFRILKK